MRLALLLLLALLPAHSQIVREKIEWLDIWIPNTNDHALPRVLLIGDSITRGYGKAVETGLKDKAYAARLATSKSLGDPALLEQIALVLHEHKFDIIHCNNGMVRPERRIVLAGESPVRVSAEAPGSRLQAGGEIRPYEAECQRPLKEKGATQRAATSSERNSLVKLSAERCLGGPSRSCHGEGNRQHSGTERMLDLPGVAGGGTLGKNNAEQERPYLAAESGKDRRYKAGWLKTDGAGRESERSVLPGKACITTRWREGALL
jgi:hypothetical protein